MEVKATCGSAKDKGDAARKEKESRSPRSLGPSGQCLQTRSLAHSHSHSSNSVTRYTLRESRQSTHSTVPRHPWHSPRTLHTLPHRS